MNMNNIRRDLFQLLNEIVGCRYRSQPMSVKQSGFQSMHPRIPFIANRNRMRSTSPDSVTPLTISHVTFPSVPHCQFPDFLHNASRRSRNPYYRIYLQQPFHFLIKDSNSFVHCFITVSSEYVSTTFFASSDIRFRRFSSSISLIIASANP